MRKIKIGYLLVMGLCVLSSCNDMNDNIDQYLSAGETIYIAKSDSVKLCPGKNRFLVQFWIKDPRAVSMDIQWNQGKSSQQVAIAKGHDITEPIEAYVENLEDGDYTVKLVTSDIHGNKSVPDEYSVIVYGATYQSMLMTRTVKGKTVSGSNVTITWGNSYSSQEVGVNVYYTDTSGAAKTEFLPTADLSAKTTINGVDVTKEISYETVYLPAENAIDYFYTNRKVIE